MAARVRLPNFSSFPSKRSNSVNASAVPPANAAVQAPHLAGVALHDALSERHLAVAADDNPSVTPYRENRGSVNPLWIVIHVNPIMWGRSGAFQAPRRRARG